MPIYEYRCDSCSHELEVLQKMSESPLEVCPACHQKTLVKLISASGFQLKGTGWYVTDFKGDKKKTDSNTPSAASKPTTSTSSE
ncbi:FmdB family zinc ribbon protein [Beggiatoa leptomitoformis]|uniref:Zinc ribbon domain-containing protein n=1 Tax=Beggiatoa leptomitoformis TaxID=288004 RepID=A0A2N9YBJ1_9GAMM|nr:zinc ribbon domain-containing protein [Beggiatoa leptomitoformis]ALG66815.1 zinc ribbon domain-containing protein [Beggiatoa leptomitoformis]AUI67836.1 zinc ribbon domain-containing protein [Beggiatoa leptomitoformis]